MGNWKPIRMTLEFDPRGTSDRPQASSIRSSQKIGQKTRLNAQDDFDQARGSRRFPLGRGRGPSCIRARSTRLFSPLPKRPWCACPSCRTTASNNSHTIVPRRAERLISQFPKFPNFLESLGWATIPCLDFIPLAHGGVCGLFLRPSLFVPRESV